MAWVVLHQAEVQAAAWDSVDQAADQADLGAEAVSGVAEGAAAVAAAADAVVEAGAGERIRTGVVPITASSRVSAIAGGRSRPIPDRYSSRCRIRR